jgi:hypothetical protein
VRRPSFGPSAREYATGRRPTRGHRASLQSATTGRPTLREGERESRRGGGPAALVRKSPTCMSCRSPAGEVARPHGCAPARLRGSSPAVYGDRREARCRHAGEQARHSSRPLRAAPAYTGALGREQRSAFGGVGEKIKKPVDVHANNVWTLCLFITWLYTCPSIAY